MDRVPPEIWELIFNQLKCPEEFHKACRTSNVMRNYLTPSMPLWMFEETLLLLLPYLSKNDVLRCRGVCKKWNTEIDNFLENHVVHRPIILVKEDDADVGRIDQRAATLHDMLQNKKLLYVCNPNSQQMKEMLDNAGSSPNYPIVGRSLSISQIPEFDLMNRKFLEVFGSHVWFLNISIRNYGARDTLEHILELLGLVPNLKKLQVTGITAGPVSLCMGGEDEEDIAARVPKLETLLINLRGPDNQVIKFDIFDKVVSDKLTTLHLNYTPELPYLKDANLYDLGVELDSDPPFEDLLELEDLHRLSLTLCGRIHGTTIFRPLKAYCRTLRNFELKLTPEFYNVAGSTPEEWAFYLEPFSNREALQKFPFLKRVSLEGCRPLSLNFLFGLMDNLENLHVSMDNLGRWEKFLEPISTTLKYNEELDLLENLKLLSVSGDKKLVYGSNVWTFFTKLKILTVKLTNDFGEPQSELVFNRCMR